MIPSNTFIIFLACTCDIKGTKQGDQCAHNPDGDCRCKPGVTGLNCDRCVDGFYGFGKDSRFGCRQCQLCDKEGTVDGVCEKKNGYCKCHNGFYGEKCDKSMNLLFHNTLSGL